MMVYSLVDTQYSSTAALITATLRSRFAGNHTYIESNGLKNTCQNASARAVFVDFPRFFYEDMIY